MKSNPNRTNVSKIFFRIFLILFLAGTNFSFAQEIPESEPEQEEEDMGSGIFYVGAGTSFYTMGSMNDWLNTNGYRNISGGFNSIFQGVNMSKGFLLIGYEAQYNLPKDISPVGTGVEGRIFCAQFILNAGINIIRKPFCNIQLMSGAGPGAVFLSMPKTVYPGRVELTQEPTAILLRSNQLVLDAGLRFHFFPGRDLRMNTARLTPGISIGYMHSFNNRIWNYNGAIYELPRQDVRGFYTKILVGFGS